MTLHHEKLLIHHRLVCNECLDIQFHFQLQDSNLTIFFLGRYTEGVVQKWILKLIVSMGIIDNENEPIWLI